MNHFSKVCRSGRNRTIHNLEQRPDEHHKEVDHIDTVNINSAYLNSKHLAIMANVETLSNQASIIVPFQVDTGSDGNIIS